MNNLKLSKLEFLACGQNGEFKVELTPIISVNENTLKDNIKIKWFLRHLQLFDTSSKESELYYYGNAYPRKMKVIKEAKFHEFENAFNEYNKQCEIAKSSAYTKKDLKELEKYLN